MGNVHREFLKQVELSDYFADEIYSDEVGIRKPNPDMIHHGALAAGVKSSEVWYVGDNFDRDALCGYRAGVGGNIVMESNSTSKTVYDVDYPYDKYVKDPFELLELLKATV